MTRRCFIALLVCTPSKRYPTAETVDLRIAFNKVVITWNQVVVPALKLMQQPLFQEIPAAGDREHLARRYLNLWRATTGVVIHTMGLGKKLGFTFRGLSALKK